MDTIWKDQLGIALRNTIKNEIITASADGVVKPSQYVENCVESILSQINIHEAHIERELIAFSDLIGYDTDNPKHLEAYEECRNNLSNNCVDINHKYF